MPTRLQRFIERAPNGETSGRVAYVLKLDLLGAAQSGMQWQCDTTFNAAEAVLQQESLKQTYKTAIADGIAIVTSSASQ